MAQCIEAVSALSSHNLQEMKTRFWNMTSLTSAIESWFDQLSPAFLRHREQIRVLSVYSCCPEVDSHIISVIKKSLSRFKYVVVEPVDSKVFEKVLSSLKQSSLHSIEISPYPHFLTYETLERFDLIFVFGVPLNRSAAEIVIRKSKLLLRHGGQVCLFDSADNNLGVLINTLYSAGEDCQPGTSSYTSRVNEKIVSPGKDDSDSNSCSEEIALSMENSPSEEITSVPSQGKIEPEDESDLLNNQYPTDCNFILSLFDRLNFTYSRSTLKCTIDLKECFDKTEVGIHALSGLMKIDLSSAIDSLLNTILEFLAVRTIENTTKMTYNYYVWLVPHGYLVADAIHRMPVTTSTPWFPQGEKGPFVNYGLEKWKKNLSDWRSDGTEEPVRKMKIDSIEPVVEIISNISISSAELPEPINLDELLPLCSEVWKCCQRL